MPAQKSFGYRLTLYAAAYGPVPFYLALAGWSLFSAKPTYLLALYLSLSFAGFHIAAMRHFLRWANQREQKKNGGSPLPRSEKSRRCGSEKAEG